MDDPSANINLTGADYTSLEKLPDRGKKIIEEHNYMKIKIDNLQSQLDIAISQLDQERKLNKELTSEKSNFAANRNEMEVFFLDAIEEVKKEIQKRKELQVKNVKF